MPTYGSLCTGIGGLDVAARAVFGDGPMLYHAETDPHAAAVLESAQPTVPNLGSIVGLHPQHVDVLTAGFPCQDISVAGKGAGLSGARSGLWFEVLRIVQETMPEYVLLENVPVLKTRGLAVVLEGLELAGYGGSWCFLRSGYKSGKFAHVGAPHQRKRIFILAEKGLRNGFTECQPDGPGSGDSAPQLFPTPAARDGKGPWPDSAKHSATSGLDLPTAVTKLLPTITASDSKGSRRHGYMITGTAGTTINDVAHDDLWADYAPAVARWAALTGIPAPAPVDDLGRLSVAFVEWMMGIEAGMVSGSSVARSHQLRMLGNAVQPQTAIAAFSHLRRVVSKQA